LHTSILDWSRLSSSLFSSVGDERQASRAPQLKSVAALIPTAVEMVVVVTDSQR
jgi:hypothetical protein